MERVQSMVGWMREEHIWPNARGSRSLWADAVGVVLLVSLYRTLGEARYLRDARWVASEAQRERHGDRAAQALWLYALWRLGQVDPAYRGRAVDTARSVHPTLAEDPGALGPYHGYVVYRLIDPSELSPEIDELESLVEATYPSLVLRQDLGLGLMLWLSHFFPNEPWARVQRERSLAMLEELWVDPPGYFCELPGYETVKHASSNYVIAVGLAAVDAWPDRGWLLSEFFRYCLAGAREEVDAATHVLACCARFPGELVRPPR